MLDGKTSASPYTLFAIFLGAACGLGVLLPFYLGVAGDGVVAIAAVPLLLIGIAAFAASRKTLLILILLTRSALDIVLEATRTAGSGQGAGLGALINLCIILLAFALVFEKPAAFPRKMAIAWLAFFAAAIHGILLSPEKADAIRFYLTWLSNFAVFISAFYLVRESADFRYCALLVVLSSILPALYGLYETGANLGLLSGGYRIKSTFTHANIFAFYLMLVQFIGFYYLKSGTVRMPVMLRMALGAYLLLLFGLLMLTQTRSAWIAVVVVFACYAAVFERRYLIYLGLAFVASFFIPVVQERLLDILSDSEVGPQVKLNSFAWRVALWESALGWMDPGRYLLGYGLGAFRDNVLDFFPLSAGFKWDAHNVYVQWFFETGLLGVAAYLWLQVRMLGYSFQLRKVDRLAAFFITATVVSYLMVSFSDNMMFYLVVNWYYWFLIGAGCALLLRGAAKAAAEPRPAPQAKRPAPWSRPAGAAVRRSRQ
ncbi:O-antigen ligase [Noviherbaspirillum humi]|uniref:O-antigen ligase n=1 Tax=Noviherbaspirillum humi TaxID=1688639 RepID=A0A239GWD1_9BURK|nr:O-antigen ligase family protein [Noviherbaspirillum humi]SNS73251.1 O-antigen ligase [Noviherbaspirillum humi]